ncbi:MAG TPA: CRTAC1 family protein, partial [Oceanospirillales bacterium]|nr:CRTAC1 family protein [Oceanospirillales bacterium]
MHIHTFYYNTKIPTLALLLTILSFPSSSQVTFDEVAASAGLSMIASNVESLAWGDYNNDGWEDVYLSANGANTLMQNNGDGTFTNIIDTVGAQEMGWSVGAAFADFDNDGDLDLFLLNFGAAADNLFRNNGAANNYSYTNVAASAGLTSNTSSSRGVTLIDFNRDGLVDIYVDAIGPNLLYQNMGGLTFVEVATANGVAAEGTGVGAVMSDIDNNGWPDLFTGNRSSDPNRLYFNSATGFTDVTSNGIDKVGLGMGVVAFDYDNDLDVDLYWTTWPGAGSTANAFYENQNNQFVDVAVATGTTDTTGWGISANVGDANNDGWQDLFVSNGFDANTGPNVLFVNQGAAGNQTFFIQDMGAFDGRGVAWADFDNDGDLDALVTGGPAADNRLFKNTTVNLNQWLQLQLKGTIGNRSAIGARVEVNTNSGVYMQEVSGGAGRGSQNSLRLHFGLGAATQVNSIFVRWPNGNQQTYHY